MQYSFSSLRKDRKSCPECGSMKFGSGKSYGSYPKEIYVPKRTIYNHGYRDSSDVGIMRVCLNCGLEVGGSISDERTEIQWSEEDITEHFIEKADDTEKYKMKKKLNMLFSRTPRERKHKIQNMKFSDACIEIEEIFEHETF